MSFRERFQQAAAPMWNQVTRPVLSICAVGLVVICPVLEVFGVLPASSYDSVGNVIAGMVVGVMFGLIAWRKPGRMREP